MNRVMGIGYLGETRMGPDGNLYQWVEGIDGLGNPIGFWNKKFLQKALKTAARYHPAVQALKLVSRGVSGYDGLGALYEAQDGSLYQMQGLAEDQEMHGLSEDEATQMMGIGSYVGEVRQGVDGNLYQWVQGVDGLGNPIGSWWRKVRNAARKVRKAVKETLPIAQKLAPFIPGGSAVLTAATPILKQAGVAGYEGLGVYQAPDGTFYQMQGLAEDEELQGYGEDEALYGYGEDEELRGLAEDEDLQGYGEEEELRGMEGYIQQNGMSGMEGYVREQRPTTPRFAPTQAWTPPW